MPCVRVVLNLLTQVGTQNTIAVLAQAYHIESACSGPENESVGSKRGYAITYTAGLSLYQKFGKISNMSL